AISRCCGPRGPPLSGADCVWLALREVHACGRNEGQAGEHGERERGDELLGLCVHVLPNPSELNEGWRLPVVSPLGLGSASGAYLCDQNKPAMAVNGRLARTANTSAAASFLVLFFTLPIPFRAPA